MMHPRQEVMQCTRIVKDIQENIMPLENGTIYFSRFANIKQRKNSQVVVLKDGLTMM